MVNFTPGRFTIRGRTALRFEWENECAAELNWTFWKREKSLDSTGI